jgi:hypothetical protein
MNRFIPKLKKVCAQREVDGMNSIYKMGRPGEYLPTYPELLKRVYMLNHKATLEEVAKFFSVSEKTLLEWVNLYPKFREAKLYGAKYADLEVVDSLHYLATKHKKKTKKVFCYKGEVVEAEYDEEVEPEAGAIGTWFNVHGIGAKDDSEATVKIVVTQEAQGVANGWVSNPKTEKSIKASAKSVPAKVFDPLEGL